MHIRYRLSFLLLAAILFISVPLFSKSALQHQRREQIISDFTDAAFAHRFGENDSIEQTRLHRWEKDTISVSFADKPQDECCVETAYYPKHTNLDAASLSKMSDNDKSFYTEVRAVLPNVLNELEDITGKSFQFYDSPALEQGNTHNRNLSGVFIRPAFSPTKRREICLSIDQMALDSPPSAIYFYVDACRETTNIEGLMYYRESENVDLKVNDHLGGEDNIEWEITNSICQFWPLKSASAENHVKVRECLARALGLPNLGLKYTDIEMQGNDAAVVPRAVETRTSVNILLELLYCNELESGMTIDQVTEILRGNTGCFSKIEGSKN